MRRLPPKLLREHGVEVAGRDGKPEPAWQQVLRLNQSLWRQEQSLEFKTTKTGVLGSCLGAQPASRGLNLMSPAARNAAKKALSDLSKLVHRERLYENLLRSQALCFSIFGELRADLGVASGVISALLGKEVQVIRIELEHSPGRGNLSYTGDHSAADAFIEYTVEGHRGFLCIETKYFEDLGPPKDWKDPYRLRYSEVAAQLGCFKDDAERILRMPPLEQLWRDHLLAGSILFHPDEPYDEGYFVIVYPEINEACSEAVRDYRALLANDDTFRVWTLETVVEALMEHADYGWAWAIQDRYLDYYRVDHAYQAHYIQETTNWARTIRTELGELQAQEGHRVWFRPGTSGFGMVGLLSEKPQLGSGYTSTAKLLGDFEGEFSRHCDGPPPERVTPEKAVQSFLVSNALTHGRRMAALDPGLTFLMDELVIPSISGDQRLDVLALRRGPQGSRLVLIELKSERAMKELLRQTQVYGEFLDNHRERLGDLASALLGKNVEIIGPCERWIVWPAVEGGGPDPRNEDFAGAGVRVVGYREVDGKFEFVVGPEPSDLIVNQN